ncbi:MAG: type II toxin-antitoxin system Phd/YefM family antitoxin [Egibacteraceae bacterium]
MTDAVSLSEAKAHLSELADRVEREHARIMVTRHGRPALVLLSPDDLESMEETIEILRDPDLVASLQRSREEAASGQRLRLRDHV